MGGGCNLYRWGAAAWHYSTHEDVWPGLRLRIRRVVDHLVAAEVGSRLIVGIVAVQVRATVVGQNCAERRQCWHDQADWRRYNNESRPAWLEPDSIVIPVGGTGIADSDGSRRQVANHRAAIRIEVIVTMTGIPVFVIGLDGFREPMLIAALSVRIRWIEAGNQEGGSKTARQPHRSSPTPGVDIIRVLTRQPGHADKARCVVDIGMDSRFLTEEFPSWLGTCASRVLALPSPLDLSGSREYDERHIMSRTPNSRKEETHERIVDVAARAIRRNGYAGVGVAEVMKEAGLTHGGFYAHFESRDALLVEALDRASRESAEVVARTAEQRAAKGVSKFRALVETYLGDDQLASLEYGCPIAALGCEIPRQSQVVREASAARVNRLIEAVRATLPDIRRTAASVVAGTLVGSLQLARALGDNAEGRAVLSASRKSLIRQYDEAAAT